MGRFLRVFWVFKKMFDGAANDGNILIVGKRADERKDQMNIIPNHCASAFVFGGRARFELRNPVSEKSFRLHVRMKKDRDGLGCKFFVHDITTSDYGAYLGFVEGSKDADGVFIPMIEGGLIAGRRGRPEADAFKAIDWAMAHGFGDVEIAHEGRCGVCGRRLDDDISVAMGIGPVCAKRRGLKRELPAQAELATGVIADAKRIAGAVGERAPFPFRNERQAALYVFRMTDGGNLSVIEAIEMLSENPEEAEELATVTVLDSTLRDWINREVA